MIWNGKIDRVIELPDFSTLFRQAVPPDPKNKFDMKQ